MPLIRQNLRFCHLPPREGYVSLCTREADLRVAWESLFRLFCNKLQKIHLLLSRRRQTPLSAAQTSPLTGESPLGRLIASAEGGGTPHPSFAFGKIHLPLKGKAMPSGKAVPFCVFSFPFSTFRFRNPAGAFFCYTFGFKYVIIILYIPFKKGGGKIASVHNRHKRRGKAKIAL